MPSEHLEVVQSGIRYNRDLKALANSAVGNKAHPRGAVLKAFNRAKTALAGNFGNPLATAIILEEYRAAVLSAVRDASNEALAIGENHANLMLDTWGLPSIDQSQTELIDQGVATADAVLSGQIAAINAGTLTEAQVLGGPRRVGLFAAGVVMGAVNNWLITSAAKAVGSKIAKGFEKGSGTVKPSQFNRQAIAAIDENTTECCLAVHGQLITMDGEFHTPESPAWALYQERPPFHRFCRTSQVLVRKGAGLDAITDDMELAAYLEKQARLTPGGSAPHPANAFTRVRNPRGVPFTKVVTPPGVTIEAAKKAPTKPGSFRSVEEAKLEFERKWGITAIDDYDDLPEYWQDVVLKEDHGRGLWSTDAQKLNQLNRADVELSYLAERFPGFKPELDDFSVVPDLRGAAYRDRQYKFLEGRSVMTIKYQEWSDDYWDHVENWKARGYKAPVTASRRGLLINDNFRHELAHVKTTRGFEIYWLDNVQTVAYQTDFGGTLYKDLYDSNWFRDNVSKYSRTNNAEQIAESFSIYTRRDYVQGTLPMEIEKAMEILTNQRELPTELANY